MIVVLLVVLLTGIFLPALHRARVGAFQIKDAAQVRETHKALVLWAQPNNDGYPVPSLLDRDDATVVVEGDASTKNSSGAIFSVLVFNGLAEPELLLSPDEVNTLIRVDADYVKVNPPSAANPSGARWDPAFRAVPRRVARWTWHTGNLSYAHLAPAGVGRASEWKNSLSSAYAVVGNRGPEVRDATWNEDFSIAEIRLVPGPTGTKSLTMLIHGSKNTWEGNIAYNDNHVSFETSMAPDGVLYRVITGGQTTDVGDCLFLDEADPASGTPLPDTRDHNIFLGLFERGPTQAELDGRVSGYLKAAAWYDGQDP
jgi:hypothetical protein